MAGWSFPIPSVAAVGTIAIPWEVGWSSPLLSFAAVGSIVDVGIVPMKRAGILVHRAEGAESAPCADAAAIAAKPPLLQSPIPANIMISSAC